MNYFVYTLHHFTPHGRYELNKLTSLSMCGFIAQLAEHRYFAEVTGSNPVEVLIFSDFFFPVPSIGKFTAMIILHLHINFKRSQHKVNILQAVLAVTFSEVRLCSSLLSRGSELRIDFFHLSEIAARRPL